MKKKLLFTLPLCFTLLCFTACGDTELPELPSNDAIAEYTALASHFGEITLREEGGKYYAKKPTATVEVEGEVLTMKLDLGGIGKGYAVDKVDELFDEYGYEYGYFSFGTSSMLVKSHALYGVWDLSFTNPRSPARNPYMSVTVQGEKISSSGDNEQFYMVDGTRYCHIIDPKTGKPVQTGIMSATVIGGSAAEDDALTTAIMTMGKERAIQFIQEELTDRRVAFTFEEEGVRYVYTNIPEGGFELVEKSYTLAPVIGGYVEVPPAEKPQIDVTNFSQMNKSYYSMNSYADLAVQADFSEGEEERFYQFTADVDKTLNSISKAISSTVTDSDIDKFNKTHAGGEVEISQITYEVLSLALSVYNLTDGAYNPALYYNIAAYGFGGGQV